MTAIGHTSAFYHPVPGDIVIGIVERKYGEDWQVDIGYSHSAILPQLAFDGATKKNCPKFKRGDLVAGYIEEVPEAGEALLSCVPRTKTETFGPLSGGTLLRLRPSDIERVRNGGFANHVAEKKIPLRVAFGLNGRAFFDTGCSPITVQLVESLKIALRNENPLEAFQSYLDRLDLSLLEK